MRELFDPDALRHLGRRVAFVRRIERPALVLGSTQPPGVVERSALADAGIELVRRRSGGGAVLLEPDAAVWIDTWVPRADGLFDEDVSRSRAWVGEWWASVLGVPGLAVHRGPPVTSRWSELICFAGIASGEVATNGHKVVGVAQWRGREGALTHSFAYLDTAWPLLCGLLLRGPEVLEAALELAGSTATLREVLDDGATSLVERLVAGLPDAAGWEVRAG